MILEFLTVLSSLLCLLGLSFAHHRKTRRALILGGLLFLCGGLNVRFIAEWITYGLIDANTITTGACLGAQIAITLEALRRFRRVRD